MNHKEELQWSLWVGYTESLVRPPPLRRPVFCHTLYYLPIGPKVVPFWGSYLEFYKVIPKRNYFGAYGYYLRAAVEKFCFSP